MTTCTSHRMQWIPQPRLTVSLAVLACVSFALHTAFAGKEVFVRSKPHVNVGTFGPIELEPALTAEDAEDAESPCPCMDGDQKPDDECSPVTVLEVLHPRMSPDNLWEGVDIALVQADLPGLERGEYLIRVYAFEDFVYSALVDRRGNEIPLETHDFAIGDPGDVEHHGISATCMEIEGTIACCIVIASQNFRFLWEGCITLQL